MGELNWCDQCFSHQRINYSNGLIEYRLPHFNFWFYFGSIVIFATLYLLMRNVPLPKYTCLLFFQCLKIKLWCFCFQMLRQCFITRRLTPTCTMPSLGRGFTSRPSSMDLKLENKRLQITRQLFTGIQMCSEQTFDSFNVDHNHKCWTISSTFRLSKTCF